jgi:methylated-DNA-[protein]-cysteine S-methyltransferase
MTTISVSVSWFTVPTPLPSGPIRVGVTGDGVVAAHFDAGYAGYGAPPGGDVLTAADEAKAALVTSRFAEYFAGRRRELDLPVDWSATSGPQRAVLQTLHRTVGFGETITYGELATRSGVFEDGPGQHALAARAVGSIMGSCPVSLLVPCHRVVAADGLGGFGGGALGMEVKRWLLTLEGVLAPTLDWNGPG